MEMTAQNSSIGQAATTSQLVDNRYLEALALLREYLGLYAGPERGQQGFEFLEALCCLTVAKAQADVPLEHLGFEPAEIAGELDWPSVQRAGTSKTGAVVNAAWKKAQALFDGMREGYRAHATDAGVTQILELRKLPSRGRVPSQYRWELEPVVHDPAPRADLPPGGLRYRKEWVDHYRVGILGLGVVLSRWRVVGFLLGFLVFGFAAVFSLLAAYSSLLAMNWPTFLISAVNTAALVWAIHKLYSPLNAAKRWRVVAVPEYLQPLRSPEPLQLVYDPDGDHIVRGVRHIGECPVCGSRVTIDDGGTAYPQRLVGRCRKSPREHVFSFDHARLVGAPLV